MQLFSSQIRPSTTISLTFLQGSEPHRTGKSVKVAPKEVKFASAWLGLHSVMYAEPTKSSLKFIRNKIHPTGL